MAVFKKKGGGSTPQLNTASLPDIVFMLLFFFMVSTTMRETEMLVSVKLPEATEVVKLDKKSLVSYIFIGSPARQYQAIFGTDSRIQLNDTFKTLVDIRDFITSERDALSEADRTMLTVSIKGDENTRMGIITDVKQELRKASALKINYSARRLEKLN
ncbi:MAG: biopolymer transporter ExbD [Bacteroidales bacterium]|nr:biopolymer transporter ExbD [Bacteroidales bacterium]MDD3892439.1 biopolymer transporter ExbD [Bacteroidales bacterium]